MAKSNYPQSLDTSREIPAVRDNILESGSEAINGIRDAIFKIERTLGINPHGAAGGTVASRLNSISDGSGKIKKEALTFANVISGPITNVDISNVAAISEGKLKLNFPTQVLQDGISIVGSDIDLLKEQIDEISALLSVHLSSAAVNRHSATAISITAATSVGSDTSLSELESSSVQAALEGVYDSHINYTGSGITSLNNSHTADQIFFDNSNVSGILSSDDVQEAIEEAVLLSNTETIDHQDRLHSNGYLRRGFIKDVETDTIGLVLAKDQKASFSKSSGESDGLSKIVFDSPIELGFFNIVKGDYISIEDDADTDNLYSGVYEISVINKSSDGLELESVEVYGYLHGSNTSTTYVTISKNPRTSQPEYGLSLGVREKALLTSADSIQIANPDSTGIVSKSLEPSEITSSNRYIYLSVDGDSDITLDLYDTGSPVQSAESISKKINEQVAENNYNFLSYRVELENGGVEFAIVHNQPNNSTMLHTLKVSEGSDGAITSAGLSEYDGLEISSGIGSLYFVNGVPLSGLKKKLGREALSFFSGNTSVTIGNFNLNFLELNIKKGDLLIISGAENDSDNGSFVISNVLEQSLVVSSDQLPEGFIGDSTDSTMFEVYENIINLDSIVFDEVSESFGAAIVECYITEEKGLVFNKRLEYAAELSGSNPIFSIVDLSDNFYNDDQLNIRFEVTDGNVFVSFDSGKIKRVTGINYYSWIKSGNSSKKIKIFIPDVASLNSYIVANGTIDNTIYGYDRLNTDSNLLLGKIPFGNYNGRIIGGIGDSNPRIINNLHKGSVSWSDLGSSAVELGVVGPIRDLRSGGVISGLEVLESTIIDGVYNISVDAGTCYVDGKRFDLNPHSIKTNIESSSVDKFYVAISTEGDIVFAPADSVTCNDPFAGCEYITIATIEYDNITVRVIDLRLFVNDLDLKLLNSITVSPDLRLGHFDSIPRALNYARRFSKLYPEMGTPTLHLKSGIHDVVVIQNESGTDFASWLASYKVNSSSALSTLYSLIYESGLFLDFPINIEGEGESTVLKIRNKYIFSDQVISFRGSAIIPGDGFSSVSAPNSVLNSGFIKISNLKLDNSRISLVDMNIETGSTTHVFGVDIDNIIVDFEDFANNDFDTYYKKVGIELFEKDDESEYKGNLRINNCKFINSFFKVYAKTRIRNLRFSNNTLFGDSDGYLINGNIVSFASAPDGSNIEIYGNYIADNHNGLSDSDPPMITPLVKMATRMESDLYIGGSIILQGENNFMLGDSYKYDSQLIAHRHIYVDDLRSLVFDGALGSSGLNITGVSTGMHMAIYNNGTRNMYVVHSQANTTDEWILRIPDVKAGQTLESVTVHFYVQSPSNVYSGYDLIVYSEDQNLNRTTESSETMSGSIHSGGVLGLSSTSNISISGGDNKHFYISLKRANSSGLTQYITHISYSVGTETVEGIGGF